MERKTLREISCATAKEFDISYEDLFKKCRKPSIAHARIVSTAIAHEQGHSVKTIIAYHGYDNHSSVNYAYKAVEREKKIMDKYYNVKDALDIPYVRRTSFNEKIAIEKYILEEKKRAYKKVIVDYEDWKKSKDEFSFSLINSIDSYTKTERYINLIKSL